MEGIEKWSLCMGVIPCSLSTPGAPAQLPHRTFPSQLMWMLCGHLFPPPLGENVGPLVWRLPTVKHAVAPAKCARVQHTDTRANIGVLVGRYLTETQLWEIFALPQNLS